jgi:hypothetical protein
MISWLLRLICKPTDYRYPVVGAEDRRQEEEIKHEIKRKLKRKLNGQLPKD